MHRSRVTSILSALGVLVTVCACGRRDPTPTAELRRALAGAPGIEIHLPGGAWASEAAPLLHERVRSAARALSERRGVPVEVLAPGERGRDSRPRIVLASPGDPLPARLLEGCSRELAAAGVPFDGHTPAGGEGWLAACVEDPDRPGLPLNLLVAVRPQALLAAVEDLTPAARPGVRLTGPDHAVVELPMTGGGRAGIRRRGTTGLRRPPPDRRVVARRPEFLLQQTTGVVPARAQRYGERVEAALAALSRWVGGGLGYRELLAVDRSSLQRDLTGRAGLSAPGARHGSRVVLLAPGVPDDWGAGAARDAARFALGEPAASWMLDGAAIDAAGRWWGRPLAGWGARLVKAELVPSLGEIVDSASVDRFSQHVLAPARGLAFRFLREGEGPEAVRAMWRGESQPVLDGERESAFRAWLLAGDGGGAGCSEEARRAKIEALTSAGPWLGAAIDSNARPGGGFDGLDASFRLSGLSPAGLEAVSVTSFFTEAPAPPFSCGGPLPPGRESLEGDAALAQLLAASRASSARVTMLAPHLLLSDSAGYSAWLRRTNGEHWREFFDAFQPMLVHYALLAELVEADLLCLGSGISGTHGVSPLDPEIERLCESRWTTGIAAARRAFCGALTYAATTPTELERFAHWARLDFVGISFFPRLSPASGPPPDDLRLRHLLSGQLGKLAGLAARIDRPVLLVETGFRSTARAATDATLGPGPGDLAEQSRALKQLRLALEELRPGGFAPAGILFWKWGFGGEPGGDGRGYTLERKPASAQLRRFGRDG